MFSACSKSVIGKMQTNLIYRSFVGACMLLGEFPCLVRKVYLILVNNIMYHNMFMTIGDFSHIR